MKKVDNELKEYFKSIKLLLPIYGKKEKKFLSDFKNSVFEYVESIPAYNMTDVLNRFGDAQDVVHDYINALEPMQICKRVNLRNTIKKALIIVVLVILLVCAYKIYTLADLYAQVQDSMLSYSVQVIE